MVPIPTLGCLDQNGIVAQILYTCGTVACNLSNLSSVTWNRVLDDISTATVEVGITGSADDPCCECLAGPDGGGIRPWCFELAIYRNDVLEWIGPVKKVTYARSLVTIEAADMLAWLQVRVPEGSFDNVGNPEEISDIAKNMLEVAFSEVDPCLLDYAVQTDINSRPTLFPDMEFSKTQFPAYEDTYFGWWTDLSSLGLDFTTVGRSILYGAENFNLPPIGTLTDNHILGGVEVSLDGDLMANRWIVRFENDDLLAQCTANCKAENNGTDCDICNANGFVRPCLSVPCPAIVDGEHYCHGLVERVNKEGVPFNVETAKLAGQAYLRASITSPSILEFPDGTQLAPSAPFELHSLIPGVRIDVALTQLCLPVAQSFRLLDVTYSLRGEGNESISLTLSPVNIATGEV